MRLHGAPNSGWLHIVAAEQGYSVVYQGGMQVDRELSGSQPLGKKERHRSSAAETRRGECVTRYMENPNGPLHGPSVVDVAFSLLFGFPLRILDAYPTFFYLISSTLPLFSLPSVHYHVVSVLPANCPVSYLATAPRVSG